MSDEIETTTKASDESHSLTFLTLWDEIRLQCKLQRKNVSGSDDFPALPREPVQDTTQKKYASRDEIQETLEKYQGYIYSPTARRLEKVGKGDSGVVLKQILTQTAMRAEAFMQAGIPPLFQQLFQSDEENKFPLLDAILGKCSGRYYAIRQQIGALQGGARTRSGFVPVPKASVEDVLFFRTQVMRQDQIEGVTLAEIVQRELFFEVSKEKKFSSAQKEEYARKQEIAITYLQEVLADVPSQPLFFQDVPATDEATKDLVFRSRFWYLSQTKEGIETVLDSCDRMMKQKRMQESNARKKLSALFPERFSPAFFAALPDAQIEERLKEVYTTGDYAKIDARVFTDEKYAPDVSRIAALVAARAKALSQNDSTLFLRPMNVVYPALRLSPEMEKHPSIQRVVDTERLSTLRAQSDAQLTPHIGDLLRRFGKKQQSIITPESEQICHELAQRYERIMGKKPKFSQYPSGISASVLPGLTEKIEHYLSIQQEPVTARKMSTDLRKSVSGTLVSEDTFYNRISAHLMRLRVQGRVRVVNDKCPKTYAIS